MLHDWIMTANDVFRKTKLSHDRLLMARKVKHKDKRNSVEKIQDRKVCGKTE
jgi:hypothetical protein